LFYVYLFLEEKGYWIESQSMAALYFAKLIINEILCFLQGRFCTMSNSQGGYEVYDFEGEICRDD